MFIRIYAWFQLGSQMNSSLLITLVGLSGASMLAERMGASVVLQLPVKGDVKRESRWLAQYGQGACTIVAALLIWRLDPQHQSAVLPLLVAVFGSSIVALIVKRLVSRVRPGREDAGRFLGPTIRHNNRHESFPSSHSAAAVALSVILSTLYPAAAPVFWSLALICAVLRYLLDAHWPSDVFAGIALGYGVAHLTWMVLV